MNYFKSHQAYRRAAVFLFAAAVFCGVVQGGAISILAIINQLPTSPQKYFYDASGFEWFYASSLLKHLFFLSSVTAALIYFIEGQLANERHQKIVLARQAGIFAGIFSMIFLPMLAISYYAHGWLTIFSGFKAFFPVSAIIVGFLFNRNDIKFISNLLDWLLCANLAVAIAQQGAGLIYCGAYPSGCENIRSTGLFVEPNTLATLAVSKLLLLFVDHSISDHSISDHSIRNYFSLFVAFVLVMLSASRTMAVIFFIALFFLQPVRRRVLYFIAIILVPIFGYLFALRGFDSLAAKISFIKYLSVGDIWFGYGFGYGSQAHNLLYKYYRSDLAPPPVADSQVLSFVYQGGLWLLLSLVAVSIKAFEMGNKRILGLALLIFWISGATIIAMEVWPLNILIFMSIGNALNQENKINSPLHEKYS